MVHITYPILCMSYSFVMFDFHVLLSCTVFIYYIHILYSYTVFMYCVHILISYTVFMYCDNVLSSYTVSPYCIIILTFQIILHSYTFSDITSDRIISCCRTYHHIAVLCFSYHIISFHMSYSNHLFYVSCLHKP